MKIKAIIIGTTGMIGKALLLECIESSKVESVLVLNRHSCNISHIKVKEIIQDDFFNLSIIADQLKGYNTCFFCLGVSAAGLSETAYHKITYELTINIAETLLRMNNELTFCYISAAGADRSEKGRIMWARVKGKIENALLKMPFRKAYIFRPGYIKPKKGVRSRTKGYNILYTISSPLYFILKHFGSFVTDSSKLGKAMIMTVSDGCTKNILESKDINRISKTMNPVN